MVFPPVLKVTLCNHVTWVRPKRFSFWVYKGSRKLIVIWKSCILDSHLGIRCFDISTMIQFLQWKWLKNFDTITQINGKGLINFTEFESSQEVIYSRINNSGGIVCQTILIRLLRFANSLGKATLHSSFVSTNLDRELSEAVGFSWRSGGH